MSYQVYVADDHSYVILEMSGEIKRNNAMEYILAAHKIGKELGIHKYLVDAIKARNVETTLGNYEFSYEDMTRNPEIDPKAIVVDVVSPDDHSHDFVETVLRNVGLDFTLFRDKEQALEYLRGK